VLKKFPKAIFTILGRKTRHTEMLLNQTHSLKIQNRVFFENTVSEQRLIDLYRLSDLYLSCAPMEDFGIAPLEAMSSGLPVVVWDKGGTAEIIENGCGFKARSYDLSDFHGKVVEALELPNSDQEQLFFEARRKAGEYTWKNHVDILERAIESAA
jgi:glycosyltransferase involved in cell wall biosynthesis